jgi:hypothetical protein
MKQTFLTISWKVSISEVVCDVILIRNNLLKIYICIKEGNNVFLCNIVSVLLKADILKNYLLTINSKEECLLSPVCKKIKEVTGKIIA